MLKGLGNLGQIMKLQKELKNVQKKLKKMVTEGESKDKMVKAKVDGEHMLVGIDISQEMLNGGDKKAIEEAVISAVNNAVEQNKELAAREMTKITGGLNIPGLGDLM